MVPGAISRSMLRLYCSAYGNFRSGGWLERVLLCFTREVIAARSKISRAEDGARRDFPFHVEIILQCVWELQIWRLVGKGSALLHAGGDCRALQNIPR